MLAAPAGRASAAVYNIGPNQPYPSLNSFSWSTLAAGDTVNIHWRPEPYREMIFLSSSGTPAQHIVVRGIPDPNTGQLPVIDGQNAVQSPALQYHDSGGSSPILYKLGTLMVGPPKGFAWGYIPQYLDIEDLEIRNAHKSYTFTAYNGVVTQWHPFASAIYVEYAQHLSIRRCNLHGSGNGLFVNSKYGQAGLSADILVEHNYLHDNGNVGTFTEHNVYTETGGITFQYNRIGPVIPGSNGEAIKDRSAGTVIRYNWLIPGNGGYAINLSETQGGAEAIAPLPSYKTTYVYGNVIVNSPQGSMAMVRYGGGDYDYRYYRRGTLYFFNNTVINQADKSGGARPRWYTMMFQLPSQQEAGTSPIEEGVDARNNLFYNLSATPGATPTDLELVSTDGAGTLNLGVNWISPGYHPFHQPYNAPWVGHVNGLQNLIVGDQNGKNNPGFVDFAAQNLRLLPSSAAVDKAVAWGVDAQYDVLKEYVAPYGGQDRVVAGGAMDLGAFEAAGQAAASSVSGFTPMSGPAGTLVTVVGLNFAGASSVKFNGAAGSFQVVSDNSLKATVPTGATTGKIQVVTPGGTAASTESFQVTAGSGPAITGMDPKSGPVGTRVTLTGTELGGTKSVSFNGVAAAFEVLSPTSVRATVPPGATTGRIRLTAPAGTAGSPEPFTVTQAEAPKITGMTPGTGPAGTEVTLTGLNFVGVSSVRFQDINVKYVVVSSTSIRATVPVGVTIGYFFVTTPGGTAVSPAAFKVTAAASGPTITGMAPSSGPVGTRVTLTGTELGGTKTVSFNGVAAPFEILSPTSVRATVPAGATTGRIRLTAPAGTAGSPEPFTVTTAAPPKATLTGFTPGSGPVGTEVTLTGVNFDQATEVYLHDLKLAFVIVSPTRIRVKIPAGAMSGYFAVTTAGGKAYSPTQFVVTGDGSV
jgi:hypothetical protein